MSGKFNNPYIYGYFDKKNNKFIYIGKTNGMDKTYKTGSKILKRYISIFGFTKFDERFDRRIIEKCSLDNLNIKEEYYIEYYKTNINGVNITKGGKYDLYNRKNQKPILQYDLQGNFIREWKNGMEACIQLNLSNYDGISSCCKGKQKSGNGFIWSYKKSNNFPKRIEVPKRKKYKNGVCREKNQAINIGGISYNSITEASKYLNMSFGKLNYKIKNNKIDFIWLKK